MAFSYFTLDPYYDINQYNRFLISAFNNNVEYKIFVQIKPPYNYYIRVDEKNIPRFLDFDLLQNSQVRFLNNLWIPRYPNEEFKIRRKQGDPKLSFEERISNKILLQAKDEKYILFFKFRSISALKEYSRIIPKTKFHILGTKAGYKIGLVFSNLAGPIIPPSDIIFIENNGEFRKPGELESQFNYVWRPQEKLENKTLDSSYCLDGIYYPILKPIIT